jgi:hypothetical protein
VSEVKFVLLKLTVNGYVMTLARRVKGYYYSLTDYIPSTQLRGALLSEYYYQKGKIDPQFFASPAYPVEAAPSHYFSPAEGRKSKKYLEEKGVLKRKSEELEKGKPLKEVLQLGSGKKPKVGTIIRREETTPTEYKYSGFSAESFVSMHVAIDKRLGSSYHGMLFAYEYKKLGVLWALAKPSEVIDVAKSSTLKLGRGKSRSNAEVRVEAVREVDLPEPQGLSYCLSQCVPSLFGKTFFSVGKVEGKSVIIGETSVYSGWFTNDRMSGQKPSFKTLSEGSLVYVKEKGEYDKLLPAGLNFMVSVGDLGSLLDKVRVQ